MEDEAEKLMHEALAKNFIDYEEYPVSADIQVRPSYFKLLGSACERPMPLLSSPLVRLLLTVACRHAACP